jgi:hypothetical protein
MRRDLPLFCGFAVWCAYLAYARPGVLQHAWAEVILLLAALVLLQLLPGIAFGRIKWVILGAACSLAFAYVLEPGWLAAAFALPWLGITLWQFREGVQFWLQSNMPAVASSPISPIPPSPTSSMPPLLASSPTAPWVLAQSAGRMFMVVGGLWALSDRLSWQPLGFSPEIVLLTAVHFHFAGLFFPMLTGLIAEKYPSRLINIACYLVVISVPMTAIGITLAQLQWSYLFETVAAATVALAGWFTAFRYFTVAVREPDLPLITRTLWFITAISLVFTMTLAFGYAIRPFYSFPILDIPVMRAWHGSFNAFGVATAGLLGWYLVQRK